ncbi:hypothetical protein NL676_028919 [Syzygium grande]|nr:hypothetical protein NL676_028919 [Syzygium grande]
MEGKKNQLWREVVLGMRKSNRILLVGCAFSLDLPRISTRALFFVALLLLPAVAAAEVEEEEALNPEGVSPLSGSRVNLIITGGEGSPPPPPGGGRMRRGGGGDLTGARGSSATIILRHRCPHPPVAATIVAGGRGIKFTHLLIFCEFNFCPITTVLSL